MPPALPLHVVVRTGSERERGSGGDQEGDWCPSQPDATLKQTPPLSVDSALGLRLRETARTAGSWCLTPCHTSGTKKGRVKQQKLHDNDFHSIRQEFSSLETGEKCSCQFSELSLTSRIQLQMRKTCFSITIEKQGLVAYSPFLRQ